MSLPHAILGFLGDGPSTGYDLKKRFDVSVRHFWPADQAQIYRTLSALLSAGWAEVEGIPQVSRPSQKRYTRTEAGEAELLRWLRSDLGLPEVREATLVQVFFAHQLPPDEAIDVLRRQLAAVEAGVAALEALRRPGPVEGARRFERLTLEHGLAMRRAEALFLRGALADLEAR